MIIIVNSDALGTHSSYAEWRTRALPANPPVLQADKKGKGPC